MNDPRIKHILFLCTGNACRSQMAEGFAREMLPPEWRALSAGVRASGLNPRAAAVMSEIGFDISRQRSKTLDDIPIDAIDYVVTLCGHARDMCPVFPRAVFTEHWPIDDPVRAEGTTAAQQLFRRVRDDIRRRVQVLAKSLKG